MSDVIILDRDGVINHDSDDYIKSPEEWIPIDGSIDAIAALKHAGYRVAVATNQSGLGRGYFDLATLEAMHEKLHGLLAEHGVEIDGIFYCPHAPDDHCDCRKPKPGLLHLIRDAFDIDLEDTFFIGDSISDLKAARSVGARPVLVRTGKGERTLAKLDSNDMVPVYDDLQTFTREFLSHA
jgi:D-glycero-D-manno-heptose 1,7-bisphosphate phosphatase